MPSFKPLAADASPATRPAATRAVVPYRTFFITKVPFSSSEPTALGAEPVRLLEPPKSWAPWWPRRRTRKEFDALNVKLAKRSASSSLSPVGSRNVAPRRCFLEQTVAHRPRCVKAGGQDLEIL